MALPNVQPQLIIAANGGSKNTKKEQQADIVRTKGLKAAYEDAKTAPNAEIRLLTLTNEN